ncbi:MAG TPA: CopG family transcriptional regulator [Candidatus Angelobacter sp.]|jgi:hypothetical protein
MRNDEQRQKTDAHKDQFLAMAGLIGKFGAGAFSGPQSEKLALSMNAAELEQVDVLIEQGLYASREAFLQCAAHNLLRQHGVGAQAANRLTVAGMAVHNRKSLEILRAASRQLEINVTGIFRLADDVTPELACAVIKSLKVRGLFQASAEVRTALKDRIL